MLDPDHLALAGRVPRDAEGLGPGVVAQVAGLVHLRQRVAREDLRAAPRSTVLPELERQPPGQILDARPEAPFGPRRRRRGRQVQLVREEPGGVPGRAPVGQGPGQRLEPRAVHPERLEDPRPHVLRVRHTAAAGHDLTEQLVGQVRVLLLGVGRDRRGDRSRARQIPFRRALVLGDQPVGPGRIGLQAALVREHPADRHGFDRPEWARHGCQLGQMHDGRVVQMEQPLVAQLEDRGAGERLRDRRDAIEGGGVGDATRSDVREPHAGGPGEDVPVHDPDGRPGQAVLLHERGGLRLELRRHIVDRLHLDPPVVLTGDDPTPRAPSRSIAPPCDGPPPQRRRPAGAPAATRRVPGSGTRAPTGSRPRRLAHRPAPARPG